MTKQLKLTLLVIGLVFSFFIICVSFFTLSFRVTKTTPDSNLFPTVTPWIDIYASKDIEKVERIILNDKDISEFTSIEGNRIRVSNEVLFQEDKHYFLKLLNITAKNGKKIQYTYNFTPVNMPFSQLPEEVKQATIQKSSSGQVNDPFFNNSFPLIDSDYEFEVDVIRTDGALRGKQLKVIFLSEVFDYDTNSKQSLPDDQAEQLRTKVLKYIESRGGKPNEYEIHYENTYLETKYNDEHTH